MTFTAKTKDGEIVCSLDFDSKFEILDKYQELYSPWPDCSSRVSVVSACGGKRMHFRHPSNAETAYVWHKESPYHFAGKEYLLIYLREKHKNNPGVSVRLETPVELPNQKRIIDVAVLRNNTVIEAHEIQLSPQTPQQLDARSDDYSALGIDVTWYFGGSASGVGEPWAMERFGYTGSVRFVDARTDLPLPSAA
jgi:competence CoiA-like predicted nuclease